ncbi:hypothetical protein [Streptomyces sp. 8N706]|uniref:hypothetical protein n=1 Tax=Streptomyces sp. 8N706 TaxID=3457416 RepID=UPI003FD60C8A
MKAHEWDRMTMAVVACALANDGEGAAALLEPLDARDVSHIAVRLAAMAAEALLLEADAAGVDRAELLGRWQAHILAHEARTAD